MLYVKLFVTSLCFKSLFVLCVNYCDICINHTLCIFNVTGSSNSCEGYDSSVLIKKNDINSIVSRMNERRNLVASGLTRNNLLPHAANMRRIDWSNELAESAQRWADQCDTYQHPDMEDNCRNLEGMKVGQCVASISGATSGLNIKSFVDSWFMKSLIYRGSVSYYNRSNDHASRQFTQLIWANTYLVGCGRAKFYINDGRTPIDRLVCNFAPAGNVDAETVYAIGFPATQCPKGCTQDPKFVALCTSLNITSNKDLSSMEPSTVSSILRILNLANSTRDLDPLTHNLMKLKEIIKNETGSIRNQKIRHITKNESFDYVYQHHYAPQELHSYQRKPDTRIHYSTKTAKPSTIHQNNNRRLFHKCTRKTAHKCSSKSNALSSCTRGIKTTINNEYRPTSTKSFMTLRTTVTTADCIHNTHCTRRRKNPRTKCSCDVPTKCQCIVTEKYIPTCNPVTDDCDALRLHGTSDVYSYLNPKKKPHHNSYYDIHPQLLLQSGENDNNVNPTMTGIPFERNYRESKEDNKKNKRLKRQLDLKEFEPFWKDNYPMKKPTQLKSIRYTSLPKKKSRKSSSSKLPSNLGTEAITIKSTVGISSLPDPVHRVREKYLSFDELMTLRKNNMDKFNEDSRRQASSSGEKTTDSSTLYSKINHCTRKLTCTWTTPTLPGKGKTMGGGGGSRTQPGHVEGCSRTSTCTRVYMDRNKVPQSDSVSGDVTPSKDEDYCEKRSLKVQRRNSEYDDSKSLTEVANYDENDEIIMTTLPIKGVTIIPSSYSYLNLKDNNDTPNYARSYNKHPYECICSENSP